MAIVHALTALSAAEQRHPHPFEALGKKRDLAQRCKEIEARLTRVNCGWMDQMSPLFGTSDHILMIMTEEGHPPKITTPRFPTAWTFALIDADQTRAVAELGKHYNELQVNFKRALKWLRKEQENLRFGVPKQLFDLQESQVKEAQDAGMPAALVDVALHSATEAVRLGFARGAIKMASETTDEEQRTRHLANLAQQMHLSHESLRTRCHVSTDALDYMVSVAEAAAHVLDIPAGAKLVGAGYGGAVLCVIPTGREKEFDSEVKRIDQAVVPERPRPPGLPYLRTFCSRPYQGLKESIE